jgi:lipopolysaccharide transport system permease protein
VVDGFRWALLGKPDTPGLPLLISVIVVLTLLVGGLHYFRRLEQQFADIV